MTVERRWISVRACSEYLGCHLQTVYSWIDSHRIRAARIGRAIRIDLWALEADLEAWADGKTARIQTKGRRPK